MRRARGRRCWRVRQRLRGAPTAFRIWRSARGVARAWVAGWTASRSSMVAPSFPKAPSPGPAWARRRCRPPRQLRPLRRPLLCRRPRPHPPPAPPPASSASPWRVRGARRASPSSSPSRTSRDVSRPLVSSVTPPSFLVSRPLVSRPLVSRPLVSRPLVSSVTLRPFLQGTGPGTLTAAAPFALRCGAVLDVAVPPTAPTAAAPRPSPNPNLGPKAPPPAAPPAAPGAPLKAGTEERSFQCSCAQCGTMLRFKAAVPVGGGCVVQTSCAKWGGRHFRPIGSARFGEVRRG